MPTPADWQLPRGVSRAVWDYLHDSTVARRYDESLGDSSLLSLDLQFVTDHCRPPGRVIDLGCGTGRVAIPLAQLGQSVTAVDLSAEMLCVTGEKAAVARVRLDRVQANIVELDGFRDGTFDTAICLFSTLGMVAGLEARQRVASHAFRLLKPGGIFISHVHARWNHLRTKTGRRWLARDVVRALWKRPDAGDWPMPHHQGQTGWPMHLFTRREVLGILHSAGFEVTECLAVGFGVNGRLRWPWLLGSLRAYGFLIAARKPELTGGTGRPTLS